MVPLQGSGVSGGKPGGTPILLTMTTASTTGDLPAAGEANRVSPDRVTRTAVAVLAAVIGYPAGLVVFWLVCVRYWYYKGLGLTDQEIGARGYEREQRKHPPQEPPGQGSR